VSVDDGLHEGLHLLDPAHVGGHEREPVGERVGLGAAADDDVGAGLDEPLRDAPADAASPAGDEGDSTGQIDGHGHVEYLPHGI